jgi:alpha-L-fucosidase 2
MKKNFFFIVFFLISVTVFGQQPDIASMLNKYNVVWDVPGPTSYQSMPIGNGDIGLNVWVEANGDLAFYISKTDTWGEETKERGLWMKEGGVLMKLGLVHVSITPNIFKYGDNFQQTLKLHEGEILINEGTGNDAVSLRIWVDANNSVIHLESKSGQPVSIKVKLDNWRTNGDGDTILNKPGKIEWYHQNSANANAHLKDIVFGAGISAKGLVNMNNTTLQSVRPSINQNISIYPYTKEVKQVNQWLNGLENQINNINKINIETARKAHHKWWDDFWHRSWIFIDGDSIATKVTQGYILQRFVTACAGRGAYPIKFNGSIFTVDNPDYKQNEKRILMDADFREWGGQYWFQNTRAMYWPRLMAGDFDMMMPLFKMYANMLPADAIQIKQYYKHEGAYVAETSPFWGGLLYMGPEVKENWTGHYFTPILELSMMMLDYFEYTGDTSFAKNILIPVASNGILFFDKHFARDEKGKLLLDPDNSIEMFWKAHNPAPDIAGLHAVIQRLINLPADIADNNLRNEWKRFQAELPELPTGLKNNEQVLLPYTGLQTAISHNFENPELYAIYPFRLYGLGKPDLQLAKNTFSERRYKDKGCWVQDPIEAAMLGFADIAKAYVAFNFSRKDVNLKFPAFWDKGNDYMPDEDNGGNGENGLQEMLMQVDGKKIILLPAWPKEWNADFKLNAPYKTTVHGKVKNGKLVDLVVFPSSRKSDIVFAKPEEAF